MNFKQLINHYESLDKKELIKKLVDKNTLILKQEDEIERQNNEINNLKYNLIYLLNWAICFYNFTICWAFIKYE